MPAADWTKRQAFANHYAETGCAKEAALRAGVPATSAHSMGYRWSRDPAIVDLIRLAVDQRMKALAPVALDVLQDLLSDPSTPPTVRLSAARDVMDRVGFVAPKRPKMESMRETRTITDLTVAELERVAAGEEIDFDLELDPEET